MQQGCSSRWNRQQHRCLVRVLAEMSEFRESLEGSPNASATIRRCSWDAVSLLRRIGRTLDVCTWAGGKPKGTDMKRIKIGRIVVLALWAATVATAGEVTVVPGVLGPEGPLYVGGNLYFVGWISNTLSKWDGKTTVVLNHTPGCGHNGLALTKRKTFLVACDTHGAILELDMTGKQLRRWDADIEGRAFDAGI